MVFGGKKCGDRKKKTDTLSGLHCFEEDFNAVAGS
jgi:hypothetical protein